MQKKKILFVIHQMNHGGVQKALLSALNVLDYEKNEVTLYIRKNRIQLLQEVNKNVNRVIINEDQTHYYRKPYAVFLMFTKCICQVLRKKRWVSSIQPKLVEFINRSQMEYERSTYFRDEEEFDVAVSYIQGYTSQFVAEYVKAKKKVMFYHGSTDETHELHEHVMPQYDAIVGVNQNVQKILKDLYPDCADRMKYIENYVDAEEIRKKSIAYNIPKKKEQVVLCTCGRLTPVKGFNLAIEAAKIIKEKNFSFLWYFVGDGSERDKLERLINQYTLADNVKITGMLDNPYPYIQNCDIYVQTSYEEAHSLTIAEALRLKKPIVTTATVGGSVQIKNRENGIVVDINEKAIAEGIELLLMDSALFEQIDGFVKNCDYSKEYEIYKNSWRKLLEE